MRNRQRDVSGRVGGLAVILVLAWASPAASAEGSRACALATPAELEAALGARVAGLAGGPGSPICSGSTPTASVMLRLARKSGRAPGAAAAGLAMAKQMGAQVDLKTFGPITCSTIVPPKDKEAYGFNTTCSIDKGTEIAAVEVTAKAQRDMVPIEKLRVVAEKMAGRF
jgi:hypothetical protein